MYDYTLSMFSLEDGEISITLQHETKYSQKKFVDIVNTAIADYCITEDLTYFTEYNMENNLIPILVKNHGFIYKPVPEAQAYWHPGIWKFYIKGSYVSSYGEINSNVVDIRNKVNERIRT